MQEAHYFFLSIFDQQVLIGGGKRKCQCLYKWSNNGCAPLLKAVFYRLPAPESCLFLLVQGLMLQPLNKSFA